MYKLVVLHCGFLRNRSHSFSRLEFTLDNGYLKHTLSGKCVKPISTAANGVALGLYSACDVGHQFSFTAGGSLQHIASKKCVNTKSGVSEQFTRHLFFQEHYSITLDSHHNAYFLLILFLFFYVVLFCFYTEKNSQYATNASVLYLYAIFK